jgi:hypothetical protein
VGSARRPRRQAQLLRDVWDPKMTRVLVLPAAKRGANASPRAGPQRRPRRRIHGKSRRAPAARAGFVQAGTIRCWSRPTRRARHRRRRISHVINFEPGEPEATSTASPHRARGRVRRGAVVLRARGARHPARHRTADADDGARGQ